MNLSKAIRQVCVTAACVMLGTATVFAADMGQATGSNVNVREAAGTNGGGTGSDQQWIRISGDRQKR